METGIHVFIGFILGLIVMFFLRAEAVKCARQAENVARELADDAQDAAQSAKEELDNLKSAGANAIGRVEGAGAAVAAALHSGPKN
jgi:hypothetical protein